MPLYDTWKKVLNLIYKLKMNVELSVKGHLIMGGSQILFRRYQVSKQKKIDWNDWNEFFCVSDHFTVILKCKQKCKQTLSSLNGEINQDLLPSHYHYLQFAYFKRKLVELIFSLWKGAFKDSAPDDSKNSSVQVFKFNKLFTIKKFLIN